MSTVPYRRSIGLTLLASILVAATSTTALAEAARSPAAAKPISSAAPDKPAAPSAARAPTEASPAPVTTPAANASPAAAPPALRPTADATPDPSHPPPLHVEYVQYGVAVAIEMNVAAGATCPAPPDDGQVDLDTPTAPCILGSGGGLALRLGYRAPGPWYVGGAYEFIKMDSGNLYRLGIFQQLRAEIRYLPDIGLRAAPYVTFGLGGMAYGNEWGVETGGGLVFAGAGVEIEVSRTALLGVSFVYRPVLIAPWLDTAGEQRELGVAQFLGFDFLLEIRTEIGRR